jgi:hypothetical protein
LDLTLQLSQLLTLVESCRARIAQNRAIAEEYGNWVKIRSNVESCRQEFQKTSPDLSSPARNEYDTHLEEIKWTWLLANYEVDRTYHGVGHLTSCLSTVRQEAQRLAESLLIEPRWAEALIKFKDDLQGLEQRLIEMLRHGQGSQSAGGKTRWKKPNMQEVQKVQEPSKEKSRPNTTTQNLSKTAERSTNRSAKRIDFLKSLTGELAKIRIRIDEGMTLAELREQYAHYEVWKLLDEHGYQNELENPRFRPKQLAERLTMLYFGVSQATIQKDRQRLRKHNAKLSGE